MVAASKVLELLPEGYGYVIFTFIDSMLVNMWMAKNVMKARKDHNVLVHTSDLIPSTASQLIQVVLLFPVFAMMYAC